jgi:urease accessory protein
MSTAETSRTLSKTLAFLSLLQITDSALPIGSYSHSWGLETFIQNGTIKNADDATRAINNIIRFSMAPREGVGAALAYRFEKSPNRVGNRNSLLALNNCLSASIWVGETHDASVQMGERLLRLAESLGWCKGDQYIPLFPPKNGIRSGNGTKDAGTSSNISEGACHHCVAVGFLGAKLDIDINELVPAYLFAATTALVAALVKLVPLGHTDGQRILAQSQPLIAELSNFCLTATLSDLGGFAPLSEWAAFEHQFLYSRLFQS